MKKTANTLDGVDIQPYRRSGNSTRQIDKAIDLLFSGFKVEVRDHWKDGQDKRINELLFRRVLDRLQAEHNLDTLVLLKVIKIDKNDFTIEIINNYS